MTQAEYLILASLKVLLKAELEAGRAFRDVQARVGDDEPGRERDTDLEIAAMIAAIEATFRRGS